MKLSDRAAFRLVLAGRCLRLQGHTIEAMPGEPYPLAVLRTIRQLPPETQARLREQVDFLESLGPDGAPGDVIRRRWTDRFVDPNQIVERPAGRGEHHGS